MARDFNKVILVGNLGQDPDHKTFEGGGQLRTFSMATNLNWKDKRTQEWKSKTEWHRVVCRGFTADYAMDLKKGDRVLVEGRLTYRQWDDDNGLTRYQTEIQAQSIGRQPSKDESADDSKPASGPDYRYNATDGGSKDPGNDGGPNDDIPF